MLRQIQLGGIEHALILWERLKIILGDGRIEGDNHWKENGMRPIALGLKTVPAVLPTLFPLLETVLPH